MAAKSAKPAAVPPPLPAHHRFVIVERKLLDVSVLPPHELPRLRALQAAGGITCPTCRGALDIVITERDGPAGQHRPDNPYGHHEPEDQLIRQAKHMLQRRLVELFPSGNVALDAPVPEVNELPDIALVNPMGGKLVIEYQAADLTPDQLVERRNAYISQGIRCLWLLDARRLKLTKGKKGSLIRKAMLDQLETTLLAVGEPLLYFDSREFQVTWAHPHPDARELARLGEKKLGRVECLLRRYRLGSLRIKDGNWWVDTVLDPRVPPPGPLPANLQKKLDKRRGETGTNTEPATN